MKKKTAKQTLICKRGIKAKSYYFYSPMTTMDFIREWEIYALICYMNTIILFTMIGLWNSSQRSPLLDIPALV